MRIATGSPRSRAARRSVPIISVSRPWRRWVALTVTFVTASAVTVTPPGTVSVVWNDRNVPTTAVPAYAARVRSKSMPPRRISADVAGSCGRKNPRFSAAHQPTRSSGSRRRTCARSGLVTTRHATRDPGVAQPNIPPARPSRGT
jgi:hypothetical protein